MTARIALTCVDAEPGGPSEAGRATLATADALTAIAEVTVFVGASRRAAFAARRPAIDARVVFVDEPATAGAFLSAEHRYGACLLDALREAYGDRGPDYVELPDCGGEGAVAIQARRTRDPFLAATRIGVRAHGTDELRCVLDGWLPDDPTTRVRHELERSCLRDADVRLVPTAGVDETYRRFYVHERLAPAAVARPGAAPAAAAVHARPPLAGRPLRLLCAGPLDPRRGVASLVEALLGLDRPRDDWHLTIAGADRRAGSLETSLRAQLAMTIAGDPRFTLLPDADEAVLPALLSEHDVVVLPSRWECWPSVAIEALRANRPLLATPTGGLPALAVPGTSGWCCDGTSPDAIAATVTHVLDRRDELEALVRAAGPRATGLALADAAGVREGYEALLDAVPAARPRPRPRARPPLVSVVVPFFGLAPFVERAVASAFAQTHPEIEVIVVDDGSAERADAVLDDLAARRPLTLLTQENQGVGAARNLGISQARGRYVVPLDADNELDPRFVARAVETLEAEQGLAWVSAWTRFVDDDGAPLGGERPGYRPLAGRGTELTRRNVVADAASLIRRRVFEEGFAYRTDVVSLEDWLLYRELGDAGHCGAVIPEPLISYRVRETSKLRTLGLPNAVRLAGELRAHQLRRRIEWTQATG